MSIHYLEGDAAVPVGDGPKYICHIVNDLGRWGAGFVLAVSARWPSARERYLSLESRPLGFVQRVRVEEEVWVINVVAQHGLPGRHNPRPLQMEALEKCLRMVGGLAREARASVHLPRIGAGLARGKWSEIEPLIERELAGCEVYVYTPAP